MSFKKILSTSLFLLVAFLGAGSAGALTVSPTNFELFLDPGESVTETIRVHNDTDSPIVATIEAEDIRASDEQGNVAIEAPDEGATYSLARWITFSPTSVALGPRGSGEVTFTVSVPPNGEPGGYFGSMLASLSNPLGPEGGGTAVAQRVGSLVLLSVSGDVKEDLKLLEFGAPLFSEFGPVVLTSRIENNGTVHLKPRGFIEVENMFGGEVASLDVPQRNVLPESVRRFDHEFGEKYMFGRYTAKFTGIYGSTNEPLTAITSFWVIPWKLTLLALAVLIVLLWFFFRSRRRIRLALRVLFRGQ